MKSRPSPRKKFDQDLIDMSRRLAEAHAQVKRADREQTAAQQKLTDIGKKLGTLKTKLARLAEDRQRENGK